MKIKSFCAFGTPGFATLATQSEMYIKAGRGLIVPPVAPKLQLILGPLPSAHDMSRPDVAVPARKRTLRPIMRQGKASADDGLPRRSRSSALSHPLKSARGVEVAQSMSGGCPAVFAL